MGKMSYTKPRLREQIKARIMAGSKGGKAGQWSARKAQLLGAEYKAAGGGYKGAKNATQASLSRWGREEWGTRSGKPSIQGDNATGERYLPKAAISKLSKSQYAATTAKKRAAIEQGDQFVANTKRAIAARSLATRIDSLLQNR